MNKAAPIDSVTERLRTIISDGTDAQADQAKSLLTRLNSPVRVVLMGFPGTGKFDILNSLLDDDELPESARSVTIELRYGPSLASEITTNSGSVVQREGSLRESDFEQASHVAIEQPNPILKKISIINLVADDTPDEQSAAIKWVSNRADIAVWCSNRFGPYDREVWAKAPDSIKDHAFLALMSTSSDQSEDVKSRHRDQFLDIYSIDPAVASQEASGIQAMMQGVGQHAELGRQADLDGAFVFLKSVEGRSSKPSAKAKPAKSRTAPRSMKERREEMRQRRLAKTKSAAKTPKHELEEEVATPKAKTPEPKAKPAQPAKAKTADAETLRPKEADRKAGEPAKAKAKVPVVKTSASSAAPKAAAAKVAPAKPAPKKAAEAPAKSKAAPAKATAKPVKPKSGAGWPDFAANSDHCLPQPIFETGFGYLRDESRNLLNEFRENSKMKARPIVSRCRETVSKLSDIVMDLDEGGNPVVTDFGDMIMEAEDLIVLLENEKGEDAAIDALSLLVQIRQEFEYRAAA